MSARGIIPADTSVRQERVSDPSASAWVSANAGSGKTTVLVRRVIRLLLAGEPPARILCLTFTKAAAANMANKVLGTLAKWVRLGDEELDSQLATVTPQVITPQLRARARRLFAAALETPGGLKVQTIHAFCDRVLHQFPLEAQVPAGFEVLDELREEELLRHAREEVMVEASLDREGPLGRALAVAVASASDESIHLALGECVRERQKVMLAAKNGEAALAASLGLPAGTNLVSVIGEILDQGIPQAEWKAIAADLEPLNGNAARCGKLFSAAAKIRRRENAAEFYLSIFFTNKGEPKQDGGFGSGEVREANAALFRRLLAERDRVAPLRERLLAARALERTLALITLAQAVIEKFERYKLERGALDYGDLINRTADMLHRQGSEWVLYKLDGGIDHVLVDEAQDTSPEQWSVIEKLTEEFFAGKGTREPGERTIFAVGDEKQSIFSFQGAEPKEFEAKRKLFSGRVSGSGGVFHSEILNLSFRSTSGVLQAVDTVFSTGDASKGVSSDNVVPPHIAIRQTAPALVEIWDTEKPEEEDEDDLPWHAPLNARGEASPVVRLAQRIALAVKNWTNGGLTIEDSKTGALRTPDAGDVIVLVRRRGPLFDAILHALKAQGLPVAGADRLKLYDHIAVMDLVALGDALMLETDDLALACVLKSPLFHFSEDDLYLLARGRKGTLAASLREHAPDNRHFAEAVEKLSRWREEAALLRPFDFYSRVLGRDRGRERMLARLGEEAADAMDEFLARALAYEQIDTPSLTGFLQFLRRAGTEVKRDLEVEGRSVRVMTVHGAKGLEAPIVVLADSTSLPDGRNTRLHDLPGGQQLVWAGNKDMDSANETAARNAAAEAREAEYRRLLYVALTRAADALVVCGAEGKNELNAGCWYRLVRDALESAEPSELAQIETGYGSVLRWRHQPARPAPKKTVLPEPDITIPSALDQAAPPPVTGISRIRPSDFDDDRSSETAGSLPRGNALRRGDVMHRLFQFLPSLPEDARAAASAKFLDMAAPDFSASDRVALAAEALALLRDPAMAPLMGARSLPEVPFLDRSEQGREIAGRIDRLFAKGNEVIFVDYKTDADPPRSIGQVPEHYLRQITLYRNALLRIYPERKIRAILAYSRGPIVHELQFDAVDGGSPRREAP